jgi:Asp-tRNA(Asn)/Glu-tRNA(Gln) amidotransferase C subunit
MLRAMPSEQAETRPDASTLQQLARLAGLELERDRAERLLADFVALIEADRRLAALDLGDYAAAGDPWGRSFADD